MTPSKKHYPTYPFPLRVAFLLVYALVIGFIFGIIMGFVAQFIYLVFLFPLGIGAILGGTLSKIILRWRVFNIFFNTVAAILAGCALYLSLHYTEYILFRWDVKAELHHQFRERDDAALDQIFNATLFRETGSSGFLGYLRYQSAQGFSIGHIYDSAASSVAIRDNIVWIYWSVEFVAITGISIFLVQGMAKEVFCDRCHSWYDSVQLGNTDPKFANEFVSLIEQEHFTRARSLIDTYSEVLPNIEISVKRCPKCNDGPLFLIIESIDEDTNGYIRRKELSRYEITALQLNLLEQVSA